MAMMLQIGKLPQPETAFERIIYEYTSRSSIRNAAFSPRALVIHRVNI
jgi:hypothetical protein